MTKLLKKEVYPTADGLTVTTLYEYDAFGNPTLITRPGNNTTANMTVQMDYTEAPQAIDPESGYPLPFSGDWEHWTGTVVTAATLVGRPRKLTDTLGHITRFDYGNNSQETLGRVRSALDSSGQSTHFEYNILSQLTQTTLPDNRVVSYEYLYMGGPVRRTAVVAPNGDLISEMIYNYGLRNELLQVDGGAETIRYERDAANRIAAIFDGRGNTLSYYGYTERDMVWYAGMPNNAPGDNGGFVFRVFGYDNAGNITNQSEYFYGIDGSTEVQFAYEDTDGLLSAVTYPEIPTKNVTFSYDNVGRLIQRVDNVATQTYTYNSSNALVQVATQYAGLENIFTIDYQYYPDGSRQQMQTPGGTFTYEYDAGGRMNRLENPFGQVAQWTYTDDNSIATQKVSSPGIGLPLTTTYTYDGLGRLSELTNLRGVPSGYGPPAQLLSQFVIEGYNDNDYVQAVTANIPAVPEASGTISYTYGDGGSGLGHAHWLVGETSDRVGGYINTFEYDRSGNLAGFKGTTRQYDNQNQLMGGSNLSAFVYDERGNPTIYNGQTIIFDADNNPTAFGSVLTANYMTDGLRAWKEDTSGNRTYFLYDGIIPVCEINASGAVIATNTFGVNGLVSRNLNSASLSLFYLFDERGNTVNRINNAGEIVSNHIADAYGTGQSFIGEVAPLVGDDPYIGFGSRLGYYNDTETGFILCTYRYYDSATGRWINRDPIEFDGGANVYAYVSGNPINRTDYMGLHLNFIGFSPKEQITVDWALALIRSTKRGKELAKIFDDPQKEFYIKRCTGDDMQEYSQDGFDHFDGSWTDTQIGKIFLRIDTNSGAKPVIKTDVGYVRMGVLRQLAHELGHIVTDAGDVGPGRMDNVKQNENPVMTELGYAKRLEYGKKIIMDMKDTYPDFTKSIIKKIKAQRQ